MQSNTLVLSVLLPHANMMPMKDIQVRRMTSKSSIFTGHVHYMQLKADVSLHIAYISKHDLWSTALCGCPLHLNEL